MIELPGVCVSDNGRKPGRGIAMSARRKGSRAVALARVVTLAVLVFGAVAGCTRFGAATLDAQTLPLLAQVQLVRDHVFVGEWFAVRVRAVGSVRPREPDVSALRDFEVEYVGRADHASQRETIFQYLFRARRAGTLEISPIGVSGAGAKTKTALARVEARLPENPGSFRLRVDPEQETVYVGQQIRVQFSFEAGVDAKNIHIEVPFLKDERFVAFLDRPPFRGRLPDGYQRVSVNRGMAIARIEPDARKGRQILRFAAVIIPQRVGRIPLRSASVCATVPAAPGSSRHTSPDTSTEPSAGRRKAVILSSPTGEIRDDGEDRGFVYSEPGSLLVRELPAHDVPAGFNGLIGQHVVNAEVSPPGITLGDPLELVVSLSGQPYLANATLPDLRSDRGLLADFEVRRNDASTSLETSRKVFRYALRPKRSGTLVIPPISFSYFDPGNGRYVASHSAAVQVEVKENRVVTAADAEGSRLASLEHTQAAVAATDSPAAGVAGGASSGAGEATSPVAAEPVTVAALVSAAVRTLRSPLVFGSLLAAPLLLLAVWAGSRIAKLRLWRVAQPAAPSPIDEFEVEFQKQFAAQSSGQLSEQAPDGKPRASASATAFALFRNYAGRRLKLSGISMTFQDLAPQMRERGVDPRIIARVHGLFIAADASRFGAGSAGAAGAEPSEVRSLVGEIENELLRLKSAQQV